ncbi:TPA: RNA-directed DNA polymerase [Providencia rettgeri]|nr:RNA-directed DNA polymerase [Providencia rettgeri]
MKKNTKIDKKDYLRALLTDTSPNDVPLIFSNDGLYINLHSIKKGNPIYDIMKNLIIRDVHDGGFLAPDPTIPFKYKIKKDEHKLRTLSLIHPASQYTYSIIYRDYANIINHLCSLSEISIRAPIKITNSFYLKNGHIDNKYKEINIETIKHEVNRKHASSFFSYKHYNRIYKFFKDDIFFTLEKKYPIMWYLDIANCFNNIYTHSIEWAIKGKDYSKSTISINQRFPAILDKTMQNSNHSETNGIPVGCEFSRIFSEIILQRIDKNIVNALSIKNIKINEDYAIYRYVDDFILFSKNTDTAEVIYKEISDHLGEYNLYLNDNKLRKFNRPFLTEKTDSIIKANLILKEIDEKIFIQNEKNIIGLIEIKKTRDFFNFFINKFKIITPPSSNYSNLSSYVISSICNRITRINNDYEKIIKNNFTPLKLKKILFSLYNILFFFFYTNVSISTSIKIAKSTILINKLLLKKHNDINLELCDFISSNINSMSIFEIDNMNEDRHNFLSIERVNMLILLSSLGHEYLPQNNSLEKIISSNSKMNYFSIVSFLYIIKDNVRYNTIKDKLEKTIKHLFLNKNIKKNSELAHLALDVLSCPYVSTELRKFIYSNVTLSLGLPKTLDQIENEYNKFLDIYWFVKWNDLNLINLLERKELRSSYI